MIDLVLQANGQHSLGANFTCSAVFCQGLDSHRCCAFHRFANVWKAKTAFLGIDLPIAFDNFWIYQLKEPTLVPCWRCLTNIDYQKTEIRSDLRTGQTDSWSVVHRFNHIIEQGNNVFGYFFNCSTCLPQARVGIQYDIEFRHLLGLQQIKHELNQLLGLEWFF